MRLFSTEIADQGLPVDIVEILYSNRITDVTKLKYLSEDWITSHFNDKQLEAFRPFLASVPTSLEHLSDEELYILNTYMKR